MCAVKVKEKETAKVFNNKCGASGKKLVAVLKGTVLVVAFIFNPTAFKIKWTHVLGFR